MSDTRITAHALKVLGLLMQNPNLSGADVRRQTKLATGTVYPLLLRLEEAGLLDSEWETEAPQSMGRPRRRLYRVTGEGYSVANQARSELDSFFDGQAAKA